MSIADTVCDVAKAYARGDLPELSEKLQGARLADLTPQHSPSSDLRDPSVNVPKTDVVVQAAASQVLTEAKTSKTVDRRRPHQRQMGIRSCAAPSVEPFFKAQAEYERRIARMNDHIVEEQAEIDACERAMQAQAAIVAFEKSMLDSFEKFKKKESIAIAGIRLKKHTDLWELRDKGVQGTGLPPQTQTLTNSPYAKD